MIKTKLASVFYLFLLFFSTNMVSQHGVIEMKNGDMHEMAIRELRIEGDQLRYFIEHWERKTAVMGIGNRKKARQEFEEKSRLIDIKDIVKIHTSGQFLHNNKPFIDYIAIRPIKFNRKYELFYVNTEGKCSLLFNFDETGWYTYYVQTGNEEPYELHKGGTGFGPKLRKRSKKYFADCEPAMDYINGDMKKSTISELVEIYNTNCAE